MFGVRRRRVADQAPAASAARLRNERRFRLDFIDQIRFSSSGIGDIVNAYTFLLTRQRLRCKQALRPAPLSRFDFEHGVVLDYHKVNIMKAKDSLKVDLTPVIAAFPGPVGWKLIAVAKPIEVGIAIPSSVIFSARPIAN